MEHLEMAQVPAYKALEPAPAAADLAGAHTSYGAAGAAQSSQEQKVPFELPSGSVLIRPPQPAAGAKIVDGDTVRVPLLGPSDGAGAQAEPQPAGDGSPQESPTPDIVLMGQALLKLCARETCPLSEVENLVRDGCPLHFTDKDGQTPLMIAVQHGNVDVVKFLLEAGANATDCDEAGFQPLAYAAVRGSVQVAHELLKWGARATTLHPKAGELREQLKEHGRLRGVVHDLSALETGGRLPAELLAFRCRLALAADQDDDCIARLVGDLLDRIHADWPAVYCANRDALDVCSQTALLLQELATSGRASDTVQLCRIMDRLEVRQLDTSLSWSAAPAAAPDRSHAPVVPAALSADGKLFATASCDTDSRGAATVRLWDLSERRWKQVGGLRQPLLDLHGLAFSKNGKLLASMLADSVLVYDVGTGECVHSLSLSRVSGEAKTEGSDAASGYRGSLSFSSDDRQIFYVAWRIRDGIAHPFLRAYDTETWQCVVWHLSSPGPRPEGSDRICTAAAALHETGGSLQVAIRHGTAVLVYSLTAGQPRQQQVISAVLTLQHDYGVHSVSFSPNGDGLIATASKQLQLWDAGTGNKAAGAFGPADMWQHVAFVPGGVQCLAAGGRGGAVQLYRYMQRTSVVSMGERSLSLVVTPLATLSSYTNGCVALLASNLGAAADRQRLVSADASGAVRFWDSAHAGTFWSAADSVGPSWMAPGFRQAESSIAASNAPLGTLTFRSYNDQPLFHGNPDGFISLAYTPPGPLPQSYSHHLGGTPTSPAVVYPMSRLWESDEKGHASRLELVARRGAESSFLPEASIAVVHLGLSGVIAALLAVLWRSMSLRQARNRQQQTSVSRSQSTASLSEVILPHAAMAMQGNVLGRLLLADPSVPSSLWSNIALKALVQLHWEQFTKRVVLYVFLLRAVYTVLFIIYAIGLTGALGYSFGGQSSREWSYGRDGNSYCASPHEVSPRANDLMVMLAIMTCEYLVAEGRQISVVGWRRWLRNHENAVEVLQLALMVAVLSLHWTCGATLEVLRGISAVLILVLFWRLLHFSAANEHLGRFVRMVVRVAYNLRYYFIVMLAVYASFALSVLVTGVHVTSKVDDSDSAESRGTLNSRYATEQQVIMRLYTMIYGDFTLEWLKHMDTHSAALANLTVAIFSVYMFVMAIIILNLLIAVIRMAHGDVSKDAEVHAIRDKAQLIAETEQLLPPPFRRWRDEEMLRCQSVLVLQPAAQKGGAQAPPAPAGQDLLMSQRIGRLEEQLAAIQELLARSLQSGDGVRDARPDTQPTGVSSRAQLRACEESSSPPPPPQPPNGHLDGSGK